MEELLRRLRHDRLLLVQLLLCLQVGLVAGVLGSIRLDDVFITLAYSKSLAETGEMVFQPGEYVLGTTSALWCWLHALAYVTIPIHDLLTISRIVTTGAFVLLACMLLAVGRRCGSGWIGLLAAAGYVLSDGARSMYGIESYLACALGLAAILMTEARRWTAVGALLAAVVLTRPESAMLAAVLFVRAIWITRGDSGQSRLRSFAIVVAGGLLILPALAYLYLTIGTIIPNTLEAKQVQLADEASAWRSLTFFDAVGQYVQHELRTRSLAHVAAIGWGLLLLIATIASGFRSTRRPVLNAAPPIVVWCWALIHSVALHVVGVAAAGWYMYPIECALFLTLGFGVGGGCELLHKGWWRDHETGSKPAPAARSKRWRVCCSIAAVVWSATLLVSWVSPWLAPSETWLTHSVRGYASLAEFVNERIEQDESTGTVELLAGEIGILRYLLSPRVRIIDEGGLVQPIENGVLLTQGELLVRHRPRFFAIYHYYFGPLSEEDLQWMHERTDPEFQIFISPEGELVGWERAAVTYRPVFARWSEQGVHILYEKQ